MECTTKVLSLTALTVRDGQTLAFTWKLFLKFPAKRRTASEVGPKPPAAQLATPTVPSRRATPLITSPDERRTCTI